MTYIFKRVVDFCAFLSIMLSANISFQTFYGKYFSSGKFIFDIVNYRIYENALVTILAYIGIYYIFLWFYSNKYLCVE